MVDTGIAHEIKTMLSRFAAISVRDENSAHIVRQLLGYSPEVHMDPVLMYDFTQEIGFKKAAKTGGGIRNNVIIKKPAYILVPITGGAFA